MPTRRNFLAGSVTAFAAMATSSFAQAAPVPTSSDKKLGWAVVGIGSLTSNQILPAIAKCQKSRLAALVTGHPEKAQPILAKFGLDQSSVYSYETFDKLADNPAVDIVYIVLPNGMHLEYTTRAFKAGKHVLCEKPMANTSAECQQMIDAGKAAGKKLMIGYRCQYEPNNLKAIEIIRSGSSGNPKLIVADHGFHMGDPTAWRLNKKLAGGGPLYDIGIYSLNATRYLTGEEPVSVTAQQTENPSDPRFKEVEESMVWTMKFPSGCLATCTTSYNIPATNRIRVLLDRGMIDMEPATAYHNIKLRAPQPIQIQTPDEFGAEMDYFSDCVMTSKDPKTPGEEGLRDLKLIEAIYESARSNKTVMLA
ncbi:MAG: Gfo/Idh/MocA family oxidoreductase [Planctomycetota bacterium]|nr:Gfo/Idh/MocA family oxidoreductase [Planctomycetota bacterium]